MNPKKQVATVQIRNPKAVELINSQAAVYGVAASTLASIITIQVLDRPPSKRRSFLDDVVNKKG